MRSGRAKAAAIAFYSGRDTENYIVLGSRIKTRRNKKRLALESGGAGADRSALEYLRVVHRGLLLSLFGWPLNSEGHHYLRRSRSTLLQILDAGTLQVKTTVCSVVLQEPA